ncbi:MAG TPA: sugar transferase [Blastocatellia bacterium]|jgi:lipopolysaccharide/colanic/teichoic acid biosynthesis glycosyltransferase
MARRLIDYVISITALIVLSPLFILATAGIRICSAGPVLYRAKRAGRYGKIFTMYKFRTMHVRQDGYASAIAAKNDPRVFAFGLWLRRLKIDELPQLFNVLRGEMAIVGPRPEDPRIVDEYYSKEHMETLTVLPGLASPGSIYNYTHGERLLSAENTEKQYVEQVMPVKLALDIVYVREASVVYDLKIILRTMRVIFAIALGKRDFADPPEMIKAANKQSRVATKTA